MTDLKNLKNINIAELKQKAKSMKRHKWCIMVAGTIMSLLGIFSLFHPTRAILSLALFIGLGFIICGISHICAKYVHKNESVDHPNWFMAQGVFEVLLGFILLANLGVTALSIPIMVAFWAILDGVMRTTASFQFRKGGIEKWWVLLLTGVISILFALLLLAHPLRGVIAATFLMGLTILAWGVTAIFEALELYD
jgi:uncharacterized membrane protein HdeD (DUF308 family)